MQDALTSRVIRGERTKGDDESGSTTDSDADLVARAHADRSQFAALTIPTIGQRGKIVM
jgi:hypothetical protein